MENLPMAAETVGSWDDVPEQRVAGIPSLPRGDYQFRLPFNLTAEKWKEETLKKGDGTEEKYYRLNFDREFPLEVVATNVEGVEPHALFRGSISTMGRPRFVGKKGDPPKIVSDAAYLYRDGLKGSLVGVKPNDGKAVMGAISKVGPGKEFVATVQWPAYCNKKKVRYVLDQNGQSIEDPEGKFGCGENFRDGKTLDQNGVISERFTCKCGAAIRVFPELGNFRAPAGTEE